MNFNSKWIWIYGLEPHLPPLTSPKKMKCSFLDYIQLLMMGRAGWWTHTPSASSLQPKKWNAQSLIMFNFWWSAGLVDGLKPHPPPLSSQKMKCLFLDYIHFWWLAGLVNGLEPHPPPLSSQKYEMLVFGLHSTSDDQLGWSMDSNPIGYPSPTKKLKCSFLDYIQILISRTGWWTWTPSATPLQPKKMKCSLLDYVQLLMIGWAGRWTWTPSATPLQPKKWNAHFWITFNFWWLAALVDGLKPHLPLLSSQKNEMLIFGLHSTSDDRLSWLMDLNPICHPSPTKKLKCLFLDYIQILISRAGWWTWIPSATPLQPKKMKCSLLDYIQLLMIGWAGRWTWTPSTTPLQPKKWNAHFWITFNFWWLAALVDGLIPHPPALSSQKNEMLNLWLCSTSDDQPGWLMDSNPIRHPSPARKMKCLFLDYIHFWWLAGLVNGLEPHPPPLSSQKYEMLVFGLHSTSDDQLGWSMDSNPIGYPSPTKKLKCSFLDYIQILISRTGWWTWTPSATPLQPKKMKCSLLDYVQLLMIGWAGRWTWTPSATPLQPKKWNAHFWITFNFWWLAALVDGLKPHLPLLSSQKNEMLIFGLHSTSDDRLSWLMDLNPICHPSPTKKLKCLFLDYIQILISRAGWWTWIPSATPLQPKKMKCSLLDYIQLLMIGWAGRWTWTPSTTPLQPKKWNAHFWITFNFWWLAALVDGLIPHPPALSSQKNEMLNLWLCSTSDDQPGWLMDSNPIRHPSPARKMKCLFLDYIHFWWLAGLVNGLEPHPPPLSSQKDEMLVFGLHSTSDDQLGWSMDSNPIGYPSPTKKLKCSFLDYIQILISRTGWWTWTPSLHPSPAKKNEMFTFGLHSNSDQPGWSMDLNPIHHPSPARKIKCLFLDYIQLLMTGRTGGWTQTPSATPLQPKKWNAHFWITFNFWWSAGLIDALEPHLPPLSSQKNKKLASPVKCLPICSSLWML